MTVDPVVTVDHPTPAVTLLTLNRPAVRNALGWESWEVLGRAVADIAVDDDCLAVVLTGSGGAFSAGGDVKSSPSRGAGLGAPAARLSVGQRVVGDLLRLPKPVIAAIEGPAMGAGLSLALACDVVVAARDAILGAPFVLRGLVPDGGAAWFLTRVLGRQRASALLLSGGRMSAEDAEALGLVARLTDPGEALTEALSLAGDMASGPPEALRLTKGMIRAAEEMSFERFLEVEWLSATLDITGPDAAEGRTSFVEKRPADFSARRGLP